MTAAGVVSSLLVGVVFVTAGASKLSSGEAWTSTAREMRTPQWIVPVVPWTELAVGSALIVQLVPPYPAFAAVGMLIVFTAAIVVRLAHGETPRCACFGSWSAEPLGPKHLVRNGVLIAVSVFAAVAHLL